MKNRSSLKQVLVKILAIIVVLLISMNIFKSSNLLQSADRNTFSFFSMVRYGLIDYPVQTISNLFKDTATMAQLRSENDALRQRVDYDNHWHSLLGELETEVNELKALNDLSSVYSEHTLTSATIKNSSIEAWNQVYTIDKGSDHGIKVGDAIINPNGLVGKVIDVDSKQSTVTTVAANNEHSQVSIKIKATDNLYVNGILQSYDFNTGLFSIRLLETNVSITEGMAVSTSGMGGVYPSGFYVGEIDSVKETADSLGTIVYMKSHVNFSDLKYVKVVSKP